MFEDINERQDLICMRIRELAENEKDPFWKNVLQLSVCNAEYDEKYLDYAYCRNYFKDGTGVYLCLLYAQIVQVPMYHKRNNEILSCICRELLVEIYLSMQDSCTSSEIRDSLYWFYNDYCEIFISSQLKDISEGLTYAFGGPSLIYPKGCFSGYEMHAFDCGLYIGNRFAERFEQSFKKACSGYDSNTIKKYTDIFKQALPAEKKECFILNQHQQEVLDRILIFIRYADRKEED